MTTKKVLLDLQEKALDMLKAKLPPELSYHNYAHTLDVMKAAERIAMAENISNDDLELIKTAAVFHDTGYIFSRDDHEQRSCTIATEILSENGVDTETIDRICNLILATRVPQQPSDKLSEILCDADLDYLGRDDYFPISQNVFHEFKHFGIVHSEEEWKKMQVKFLESHKYFTQTAKETREKKKVENLLKIKESI